nr:hypothetical protein [Tanacetum cinerariifolium]
MVAYLTKSGASEGFNQVIDFLNESYIKLMTSLEGVDCLPNEEIFAELARMGYEKPSTKLTFYKAFFSSQWKFLIHTILQSLSDKTYRLILWQCKKQTVVANSTTEAEYVAALKKEIEEAGDADEHVEEVTAGDDAHGDDSAAHGEVPTVTEEPSIPSHTPPTLPPQPPQDLLSTSRMDKDDVVALMDDKEEDKKEEEAKEDELAEVQEVVDVVTTAKLITEVVSEIVTAASTIISAAKPQVNDAIITVAPIRVAVASTRRRKGVVIRDSEEESTTSSLEYDKVAQALEITKLKRRVKKLEKGNRVKIRRKGVVIRDSEEESTTSSVIPADTKSKDKGKGLIIEEPKPLKKKATS